MNTPTTEVAPTPPPPPSLRRRAPARLNITLRSGLCPRVVSRRLHVRAGEAMTVRVVPPAEGVSVEIVHEPPLDVRMSATRSETGGEPTVQAEYIGRSPGRMLPLPSTGRLRINLKDGWPEPRRVTVPVTVWPSVRTLVGWWAVVALAVVGVRWKEVLARSSSVWDIVPHVRTDATFLVELLALGVLVVLPLRLIGWLLVLSESPEPE